jgi:hypothetical protein
MSIIFIALFMFGQRCPGTYISGQCQHWRGILALRPWLSRGGTLRIGAFLGAAGRFLLIATGWQLFVFSICLENQ